MIPRLRKLYGRFVKKDTSTTSNENIGGIDDSATIPAAGFLKKKVKLPTYQENARRRRLITKPKYVSLSLSDVLSTIREEADLARRVLFETARRQRPFSIGPLKLSKDPYDVDIKLVELGEVLAQGYNLIPKEECLDDIEDFHDRRRKQDLALNGKKFKTALGTAKMSLLDLEKDFNDNVLGELKKGMKGKGDVEYQKVVEKVCAMEKKFSTIYDKVEKTYEAELEAVSASQAQEGNEHDS